MKNQLSSRRAIGWLAMIVMSSRWLLTSCICTVVRPGTEVAYLLRKLLMRLGLWERPSQLRFIAASASLEDNPKGREYIREFFGMGAVQFAIITGNRQWPPALRPTDLTAQKNAFAQFYKAQRVAEDEATMKVAALQLADALNVQPTADETSAILGNMLRNGKHEAALIIACRENGEIQTRSLSQLAQHFFQSTDMEALQATGGLLAAFAAARIHDPVTSGKRPLLPIRVHDFFRSMLGILCVR